MPAARTRTHTSWGPQGGTETCASCTGAPGVTRRTARMWGASRRVGTMTKAGGWGPMAEPAAGRRMR
jgi:hypothetical protein